VGAQPLEIRALVAAEGVASIPTLESESASLPYGGLFDIDYAKSPQWLWSEPHCSHRDGRRIDISLSVFSTFTANEKKAVLGALQVALQKSGLKPSVEGDHWHVGF
jgi:hypothetical protein